MFNYTLCKSYSPKSFSVRDEKNKATLNKLSADILPWVAQNYVKGICPPKNPNKSIKFLQGCCSTEGQILQSWEESMKYWGDQWFNIHVRLQLLTCISAASLHNVNFATWCSKTVPPFSDYKKNPKNKKSILRTFNWCINISDIFMQKSISPSAWDWKKQY